MEDLLVGCPLPEGMAWLPQKITEDSIAFYLDETIVYIQGKKHHLIAALYFHDPSFVINEIIELKKLLGLKITDEIKWNQQKLDQKKRIPCQDGILKALNLSSTTALVAIVSGDKEQAIRVACKQIAHFTSKRKSSSFRIFLDENLVADASQLWKELISNNGNSPYCASLQEFKSDRDQLLQCVDVFAGIYKTAVELADKGNPKKIPVSNDGDEGLFVPLDWYLLMGTRWLIDGTYYGKDDLPFKDAWNEGLVIISDLSANALEKIHQNVGVTYMGCTQ